MVETRERHIRVGQREVTERVLRRGGGLCRWGDYWESVPRMRTVVEAHTVALYELSPADITTHFVGVVDEAVDATQVSGGHIRVVPHARSGGVGGACPTKFCGWMRVAVLAHLVVVGSLSMHTGLSAHAPPFPTWACLVNCHCFPTPAHTPLPRPP